MLVPLIEYLLNYIYIIVDYLFNLNPIKQKLIQFLILVELLFNYCKMIIGAKI